MTPLLGHDKSHPSSLRPYLEKLYLHYLRRRCAYYPASFFLLGIRAARADGVQDVTMTALE